MESAEHSLTSAHATEVVDRDRWNGIDQKARFAPLMVHRNMLIALQSARSLEGDFPSRNPKT